MSLVTILAEEAQHVALPMPAVAYGVIAFAIFGLLGFIVFSFRDVYHRHSPVGVEAAAESRHEV